jgi:hypothetical protein
MASIRSPDRLTKLPGYHAEMSTEFQGATVTIDRLLALGWHSQDGGNPHYGFPTGNIALCLKAPDMGGGCGVRVVCFVTYNKACAVVSIHVFIIQQNQMGAYRIMDVEPFPWDCDLFRQDILSFTK